MIDPISLILGMMFLLTRSWGMMPKLTYNSWFLKHEVEIIIIIFEWDYLWCDELEIEAEWQPASILQYITSWYFHLDHESLREEFLYQKWIMIVIGQFGHHPPRPGQTGHHPQDQWNSVYHPLTFQLLYALREEQFIHGFYCDISKVWSICYITYWLTNAVSKWTNCVAV